MTLFPWTRSAFRAAIVSAVCGAGLFAQTSSQDSLPGVDLSGLNERQRAIAVKVLKEQGCTCGCDMKIAECRVKDPACGFSSGLAAAVVDRIQNGGTEQDAIRAMKDSKYSHPPQPSNRLLEDPIPLSVEGAPVLGPSTARVTIVEFSDFQCPYCVAAVPQLQALLNEFPVDVKLIFKQFPLDNHSEAAFAAAAALAAQKQGKFWQMHDALFEYHGHLSHEKIFAVARNLSLDMNKFEADVKSPAIAETIQRDISDGDRANVPGTPTLFIDGQRFNGPITLEVLRPVIQDAVKRAKGETKAASTR